MNSRIRILLCSALVLGAFAPPCFTQTITEFPVTGALRITSGPDGALWFTSGGERIGRITTTGVATDFPFPGVGASIDIATGPDGNLWFTYGNADTAFPHSSVRRITPAGVITVFDLPELSLPWGITRGPDGALWFTERQGNRIGRITTAGVIAEFPLPTAGSSPSDIVAGPDGALWFTETGGNRIGRITTDGVITEFPIPNPATGITRGRDLNLWFTERAANKIGRMTPEGDVTEFPIPTAGSGPVDIVAGNDGALWFTERDANKIGRITTEGVVTEHSIPTVASAPEGITVGPDGNVWFTEAEGRKIGRITTGAVGEPTQTQILPVVGSTRGVGGTFFRTTVQLHNPAVVPVSGRIVFHPSGSSGSESDPALSFSLAPGQSQTIADLLPAIDRSGIGSADVLSIDAGSPIVTARVFNDAGAGGTTGLTEEGMRPNEALHAGQQGVLLVPADLVAYRMNIGVRTLETGGSVTLTVRDATGAVVATVPRAFPATFHIQETASQFLAGLPLPAAGSITVGMSAGAAIVYGATVDNTTGDPSLQIARAAP